MSPLTVSVWCLAGCRKSPELAVGSLDELLARPKRVVFGLLTRAAEKELGSSDVAGALTLQVAAP